MVHSGFEVSRTLSPVFLGRFVIILAVKLGLSLNLNKSAVTVAPTMVLVSVSSLGGLAAGGVLFSTDFVSGLETVISKYSLLQ